jgi:hypothetical protein
MSFRSSFSICYCFSLPKFIFCYFCSRNLSLYQHLNSLNYYCLLMINYCYKFHLFYEVKLFQSSIYLHLFFYNNYRELIIFLSIFFLIPVFLIPSLFVLIFNRCHAKFQPVVHSIFLMVCFLSFFFEQIYRFHRMIMQLHS